MQVTFNDILRSREYVTQHILNKKLDSLFTVVDVGGAATGWTNEVADVFIDINWQDTKKLQFNIDICKEKNWEEVLKYVEKNGKFDYSICTHTLEDIYNPYLVLDMLPKISKQGIISMPSVLTEINHVENSNWLGYIHHRYMFGYKNNKMLITPKLPVLEKLSNRQNLDKHPEIRFEWKDTIPYEVFMGNYLGPDPNAVLINYEKFLKEQVDLTYEHYTSNTFK